MANTEITIPEPDRYGEIIGGSRIMKDLYSFIETIKDFDTSVLIYGETGTGKELIARSLHFSGKRKENAFIPVHCAALSDNLIESELFGHIKGAYTGAMADRSGRFKAADRGTIFLDEIGTLQRDTQVKLLRVTQERVIEPVGSEERIPVDVRIISATNRDLALLVQEEDFREDLYYRLKVLQIEVPPLRKRGEDIILLADHFIKRLNRYYRKNILGITENAKDMLMNYPWPGNVRELENAVEHAFVIATGVCLEVKDFPSAIRLTNHFDAPPLTLTGDPSSEEEKIKRALLSTQGNKDKAAEILGMHRTTLWRKIKEYRIQKRFAKSPN
jgi:transcriptional regulator with PAS, ATPase and Fis domain